MDEYVKLARNSIENFVIDNQIINPPNWLPKEIIKNRAGVFVSLHLKKDNSLRGCIGTILPTKKSTAEEIIHNAISACSQDPRFSPVKKEELSDLSVNVDILSEPEKIKDENELNHKKYGIIVKSNDGQTGLLLPDIEGVESIKEQISIACRKAGINPKKDNLEILKFTVTRHQ